MQNTVKTVSGNGYAILSLKFSGNWTVFHWKACIYWTEWRNQKLLC